MKRFRFNPTKGAAMEMALFVMAVSVAFGMLILTYNLWSNQYKNDMRNRFSEQIVLDSVVYKAIDDLSDFNIDTWSNEYGSFSVSATRVDNTVTLRINDSSGSTMLVVTVNVGAQTKITDWIYNQSTKED